MSDLLNVDELKDRYEFLKESIKTAAEFFHGFTNLTITAKRLNYENKLFIENQKLIDKKNKTEQDKKRQLELEDLLYNKQKIHAELDKLFPYLKQ